MRGERVAVRLRAAVETARQTLADAGVAAARHDAEALAAHVTGCPLGRLHAVADLSADQHDVFARLVARRAQRVPLQHLTGAAAFRHLEVAVGPGVFVPRPETEVVAGWCIEALRALCDRTAGTRPADPPPVVVDLCTGSGVIALSIAQEVAGVRVHAVERDPAAYEWARRNATGTRVIVHHADAAVGLAELDGTVDLVVANPPYLPDGHRHLVEPEVRDHDPAAALWGGPDGTDGPRLVEAAARRLLRPGGLVAVEHADHQGPEVSAIFAAAGAWEEIVVHQDLTGRDRFVTARRSAAPDDSARRSAAPGDTARRTTGGDAC
jgi:release factor glutamine methyltransferase